MSQYGMQMPAGQARRGPTLNVYTGLLFLAVCALLAATVFVYVQSRQIAPNGEVFKVYEYKDATKAYDVSSLPKD